MRITSIAAKVILAQLAGFLALVAGVGSYDYLNVRAQTQAAVERTARSVAKVFVEVLDEKRDLFTQKTIQPILYRFEGKLPDLGRVILWDHTGQVVADSWHGRQEKEKATTPTFSPEVLREAREALVPRMKMADEDHLVLIMPLAGTYDPARKSSVSGAIMVSVLHARTDREVRATFLNATGLFALFAAALIAGQYFLIQRTVLKPLRDLGNAADQFGRGQLNTCCAVRSSGEIGMLADAFNQMADRIRTDQAARSRSEEALRVSEQHYRGIVDHATDIIYKADADGRFTFMNPVAIRMMKYSEAELLGMRYLDLIHPDQRPAAERFYGRQFVKRTTSTYFEAPLVAKDGAQFWIGQHVQLNVEGDRATGFQAVARDITERKRLEQELTLAKEAAESADRAKSAFLASMSHEIRTPMNAILGMADLLAETALTAEQQKYVGTFQRAGNTLVTLINDILDLSKVEAGQVTLETVPFDPRGLIRDICDIMAVRAREKGLRLRHAVASDVPAVLFGDPTRLRQIVINLVGNALKFTEKGEVAVEVKVLSCESLVVSCPDNSTLNTKNSKLDRDVYLHVSVRDTGIGIPADKLDAVFEKFTQADASTTRKYGGTGLGLAISKQFVELMGGRLGVESAVGRGSTFFFTARLTQPAPAEKTRAEERAEERAPLPSMRRILLVDDTADNRMLVQAYLKKAPYAIDMAENGAEAVEKFQTGRYDLVLMDMLMPVLDGYEATRRIREIEGEKLEGGKVLSCESLVLSSEETQHAQLQTQHSTLNTHNSGRIPIIALTASALKEEVQQCLEAGCTAHLSKPIKKAVLLEALARYAPVAVPATPAPAEAARPTRILYLEDNPQDADLVRSLLEADGLAITMDRVETREEFLAALARRGYGLILLDYTLPSFDGLSALLLAREQASDTPVVFFSGTIGEEQAIRAILDGATNYVLKQQPARLASVVRRALQGAALEAECRQAEAGLMGGAE